MTIGEIKALFKTGAIPTQADFENLIDKIPNSDKSFTGDTILNFVNPSRPSVLGYRFVTIGDESSYIFIGLYDAANAAYIPYIIMKCSTGSPSEYGNTPPVNYTILTSELMTEMYNVLGDDMHSVSDNTIVSAIPSQVEWYTVGYNMLSATHRIVKNLLSEEHFFRTIDGNNQIYFRVVYSDLSHSVPMITNAIRISFSNGTYTVCNYILKTINSIVDFNKYKLTLNNIMRSNDIQTTEILNFINTYMKDINLTN